jgi:hypothetical protein
MSETNPKIAYCSKPADSSKAACSSVQYNKLNTGGNDPSISKKMLYAQYIRSTKLQTGLLNNK